MARKTNTTETNKSKVAGECITKNVEFDSGVILLQDFIDLFEKGSIKFDGEKFIAKDALNQRETNLSEETILGIFADFIFWAEHKRLTSNIRNKFSKIIKFYEYHPLTYVVISVNEDKHEYYNEDSRHRVEALIRILANIAHVPTMKEALEKNIYIKAYDEVYKKFGGKTFKKLPKQIQELFPKIPIGIEFYSTSEYDINAAIFARKNCGKPVNKQDKTQNVYSEKLAFQVLRALSKSFGKKKTYLPKLHFKDDIYVNNPLSEKEFKILNTFFSGKGKNATFDQFVRNLYAMGDANKSCSLKWENSTTADKIRNKVFAYYASIDDEEALNDIKEMLSNLIFAVQTIPSGGHSASGLYTGIIHSIKKNKINENEAWKNAIANNSFEISTNLSKWLTKTITVSSNKGQVETNYQNLLSTTNQSRARWEAAEAAFEKEAKRFKVKMAK